MKQIPSPLTQPQKLLPFLRATQTTTPIPFLLPLLLVLVLVLRLRADIILLRAADGKRRAFVGRLVLVVVVLVVEARRRTPIIGLVLISATTPAVHGGCTGEDVRARGVVHGLSLIHI